MKIACKKEQSRTHKYMLKQKKSYSTKIPQDNSCDGYERNNNVNRNGIKHKRYIILANYKLIGIKCRLHQYEYYITDTQ